MKDLTIIEGKVTLSIVEQAKWPLLQPEMDHLKADLLSAKMNLVMHLSIASLELQRRPRLGLRGGVYTVGDYG
jgi:hypothetical protein